MRQPLAWGRYALWCKRTGAPPAPGLARFAARYRVAGALSGLSLEGMSQAAEQGYAAALRCALAYSCLETLDAAMGERRSRTPIVSAQVSTGFRSPRSRRLLGVLEEELDDPRLVERIRALAADPADADVTVLARGVRHVVFHGGFTAYGAGAARSASVRVLLDRLAGATLAAADDRFELYLDVRAIGPWPVRWREECPSCGCLVGELHARGCEVGRCAAHGGQLGWCTGTGRHRPSTYRGVYPGTVEALKRGWTYDRDGQAEPDINRVITELAWDPRTETYA